MLHPAQIGGWLHAAFRERIAYVCTLLSMDSTSDAWEKGSGYEGKTPQLS